VSEAPEMPEIRAADVDLDRDVFLRTLLRHLAGTLEEVVGLEDASGLVSVVGARMGQSIDVAYRQALGRSRLDADEVAEVLVDLKRRIQGDFAVEDVDDQRIVLTNRACPFGDKVIGRESLCMMTSNVFGSITARNLGYAKVELQEAIARGDAGCRVLVHLQPTGSALDAPGREYFGATDATPVPDPDHIAPRPTDAPPAVGLEALASLSNDVETASLREMRDHLRDALGQLEEANQQLLLRNAELQRYAAAVAHDLRTPLVVVKGYAQLLAQAGAADLDDDGRAMVDGLLEGTERMGAVIDALLTLARLEVTSPESPTDAAAAVQVVRQELRADIEQTGATIEVGALASAWAQPTHLVQVLTNLVGNALKFAGSDRAPTIRIEARRIRAATQFFVDDDGPGVPEAERERVFELFDRGSTAGDQPGSGIGLATVRKIVESYGGTIRCEPSPLGGARFAFTIVDPTTL